MQGDHGAIRVERDAKMEHGGCRTCPLRFLDAGVNRPYASANAIGPTESYIKHLATADNPRVLRDLVTFGGLVGENEPEGHGFQVAGVRTARGRCKTQMKGGTGGEDRGSVGRRKCRAWRNDEQGGRSST